MEVIGASKIEVQFFLLDISLLIYEIGMKNRLNFKDWWSIVDDRYFVEIGSNWHKWYRNSSYIEFNSSYSIFRCLCTKSVWKIDRFSKIVDQFLMIDISCKLKIIGASKIGIQFFLLDISLLMYKIGMKNRLFFKDRWSIVDNRNFVEIGSNWREWNRNSILPTRYFVAYVRNRKIGRTSNDHISIINIVVRIWK